MAQALSLVEPGLPFVDPAVVRRKARRASRTRQDTQIANTYIQARQIEPRPFVDRISIQPSKGKTMFDHLAKFLTVTSLSATLLMAAGPLAAAETRTIAVRSADLNLTSGTDRLVLQQRIAHAVDRICSPVRPRTTAEVEASRACEKLTRANAAVQYDAMVEKAQAATKLAGGQTGISTAQ